MNTGTMTIKTKGHRSTVYPLIAFRLNSDKENSKNDWEQRRLEIEGLATEPAIEAWNQLITSSDEERIANDLGFTISYFRRLIQQEFVNKLNQGLSLNELPKLNSNLENLCWKTAFNHIQSDLQKNIETPICKQLRLKLLELHKNGDSFDEINQTFDLTKNQAKTLAMLALLESGLTLKEIGIEFQITGEAARRALQKNLGVSVHSLRQNQSAKKETRKGKAKESIEAWINSHPGCYVSEIAAAFSITEVAVRELRPKNFTRLVLDGRKKRCLTNLSKFSQEQTFTALKLAYALKNSSVYRESEPHPLTGPFYEQVRQSGEINGPSRARIIQVFGTWKDACQQAGVPSVDAVRDSYVCRWTDEQLVKQISDFILTTESHSNEKFDEWSRLKDTYASLGTIRKQLGSWSDSYELALLLLRAKWTARLL